MVCFPHQQFVGDGIVPAANAWQLHQSNLALTQACDLFQHIFAGGSKGPKGLAVGCDAPEPSFCGTLCGETVTFVPSIKILGHIVDKDLNFEAQLGTVTSVLIADGTKLSSTLAAKGFGLPAISSQFHSRIAPKALTGCELLASCSRGWGQVLAQVNQAQYKVAKAFLGVPQHVHLDHHVTALWECRISTRASTRILGKLVSARTCISLLPPDHPAAFTVQAILPNGIPDTWLQHVDQLIHANLPGFIPFHCLYPCHLDLAFDPNKCKKLVRLYFLKHIKPLLHQLERTWFHSQLATLSHEGLVPYSEILPPWSVWSAKESWRLWPALWELHRIWAVRRITARIPIVSYSRQHMPMVLAFCPLCCAPVCGLRHLVTECLCNADLREEWTGDFTGHSFFCQRGSFQAAVGGLCCGKGSRSARRGYDIKAWF